MILLFAPVSSPVVEYSNRLTSWPGPADIKKCDMEVWKTSCLFRYGIHVVEDEMTKGQQSISG